MNRYSTRIAIAGVALALAGFLSGGGAMAQGAARSGIPAPQVSEETCAEVEWSSQVLQQYPQISEACQEVVTVNGENWARVEGRLIQVNPNGSVTSMVLARDGRRLGRLTLKPAPGQKVMMDGREYSFNQLHTGAILNLYIPEHMYAVATEPMVQNEMAEIEPAPAEEVAQMPRQLPATAGPLPWVLLAGGGILLVGLGLTAWRRFTSR